MPKVQIRKRLISVEEIFHEGGPVAHVPLRRAAALAVIHNPFAGRYVEDISGFMDDLKPLGVDMANAMREQFLAWGDGAAASLDIFNLANSNTVPCGTSPAVMRCGKYSVAQRRSWLQPRRLAGLERGSTCPSPTLMLRT